MNQYLRVDTDLPSYFMYPRFLLTEKINETACAVYILLYNRALVSRKNHWVDSSGNVYMVFPLKELAEVLNKSVSTIKTALSALEKNDLIVRHRNGACKANYIYVRIPRDMDMDGRKTDPGQTESSPSDGQKSSCHLDRKLPPSKNKRIIKNEIYKIDRDYKAQEEFTL